MSATQRHIINKFFFFITLLLPLCLRDARVYATSIYTAGSTITDSGTAIAALQNAYQSTQPTFDTSEVMQGFIMFKSGFALNNSALVTYDAQGLIEGTISLGNSSVLELNSDLSLASGAIISSGMGEATILGNGHTIHLGGDLVIDSTLDIGTTTNTNNENTLIIDGGGHALDLTTATINLRMLTGTTLPTSSPFLTLKNMDLILAANSLNDVSPGYGVMLENVNVFLNDPTINLFPNGSAWLKIKGLVRVFGQGRTLAFSLTDTATNYNQAVLIDDNALLYIGPGVICDVSNMTKPQANKKIVFGGQAASLWLDGCSLVMTNIDTSNYTDTGAIGLNFQKGNVYYDNQVYLQNLGEITGGISDIGTANSNLNYGFVFGDGTSSANNTEVNVLGGAYVVLEGSMYCNNVTS